MRGFNKFCVFVILSIAAVFTATNLILHFSDEGSSGRPYRVEANRLARQISENGTADLSRCYYITNVERYNENDFYKSDSDYLIMEVDGIPYRFDYYYKTEDNNSVYIINISITVIALFVLLLMIYIRQKIIKPFEKVCELPQELAKGNLTVPLKEQKQRYFGKFIWGLDLLREHLEQQKSSELQLQKEKKTLVLSLSHDIKTPLATIELYSKALERNLFKDEAKKQEVTQGISKKCKEIKDYVDKIITASNEDFLNLEVKEGEFYLSSLIDEIEEFYADKLNFLKIDFFIEKFSDCLIQGDLDRCVEILQNIIENAVKYGDGRMINISFADEEDCKLISVKNSGCELSKNELPHIFDSFWRGSNAGSNHGSGLGLYICRELLRKMNGDIFAEIHNDNAECFMTVTAVFPML